MEPSEQRIPKTNKNKRMFRKEYSNYSFKCYKRKKGDPRKGDVAVRTVSYLAELPIAFWFPLLCAIKFFAEFSHGLVLGARQLQDIVKGYRSVEKGGKEQAFGEILKCLLSKTKRCIPEKTRFFFYTTQPTKLTTTTVTIKKKNSLTCF